MRAAEYRIEHWHDEDVDLLDEATTSDALEATMACHLARLRAAEVGGVVVVLRRSDGAMLLRQPVWPRIASEPPAASRTGSAASRGRS